jgi:hypothetical protein
MNKGDPIYQFRGGNALSSFPRYDPDFDRYFDAYRRTRPLATPKSWKAFRAALRAKGIDTSKIPEKYDAKWVKEIDGYWGAGFMGDIIDPDGNKKQPVIGTGELNTSLISDISK